MICSGDGFPVRCLSTAGFGRCADSLFIVRRTLRMTHGAVSWHRRDNWEREVIRGTTFGIDLYRCTYKRRIAFLIPVAGLSVAVDFHKSPRPFPMQNGFIERFNRSYREVVLDMFVFQACRKCANKQHCGLKSTTKNDHTSLWACIQTGPFELLGCGHRVQHSFYSQIIYFLA